MIERRMMSFYITTPLYYVNSNPHIGHAYTTILADVIARYRRFCGDEVFFLTGTDEHGQKILEAAAKSGQTPIEHCDFYSGKFKMLWDMLGVQFDDFIRTTEKRHIELVEHILSELYQKGEIYSSDYEGSYCVPCERFWTEKDLIDGNCPDCKRPVEKIIEKNYFFKMSKYQEWLIDHINNNPDFIRPQSRRNEILGFLKNPLNDLCISRPKSRLGWGIPLPFDKDYVTYVWFDALLNYISAPSYLTDKERFNHLWPASLQLMAKDIITTHAVYWPTMLKAANIEPPKTVFAHGWWMVEESKMGKSLGNAVDPVNLVNLFGRDQFRYFLMRGMVVGQDSQFSIERMIDTINVELANNIGNIASRIFKMIESNLDGIIPEPHELNDEDNKLKRSATDIVDTFRNLVDDYKIDRALGEVNMLMNEVNAYLESMAPWKMAKDPALKTRLQNVLYVALETLRVASVMLFPVMPSKMKKLLKAMNCDVPPTIDDATFGQLRSGEKIKKLESLFPRIDANILAKDNNIEKKESKELKSDADNKDGKNIISYDDFSKVKLIVVQVKTAVKAEGADKLLLLTLDDGSGKDRNLVAGIAKWYKPEELIGKKIIIVDNLKPAKIRGYLSEGMLLAADHGDDVVILTVDRDIPTGSKIR